MRLDNYERTYRIGMDRGLKQAFIRPQHPWRRSRSALELFVCTEVALRTFERYCLDGAVPNNLPSNFIRGF